MAKVERVRLLTPPFRASFPDVWQKRVFQGQGEESGRYACSALFQGFEVKDNRTIIKVPAAWSEKDQGLWKAIIAECNKQAMQTFKKPMAELDRSVYKLPFHRGEEKEYQGYGPGVVFFTMSAKKVRPNVVGLEIDPETGKFKKLGPDEFYPGCWARASVTPFAFTNIGKGIALGLNNLQKVGEGDRLDSTRSADEDFGADSSEFAAEADTGEETESASDDFGG